MGCCNESREEFGIVPMGLDALDLVRIEAGLVLQIMNSMIKLIRLRRELVLQFLSNQKKITLLVKKLYLKERQTLKETSWT